MNNQKMLDIMACVNERVVEREELIHMIAIALLTRKNLFVLGNTGQAKSFVIDTFRSMISDAKQFNIVMSKQTTAEELFGRLDLSSIIPGNVAHSLLSEDVTYRKMANQMQSLIDRAADVTNDDAYMALEEYQKKMDIYQKSLAQIGGGKPEYITKGKIPDSHICFLDEIFKAGGAILNTLLQALNERRYTNEGVSMKIPVISFFGASNEIPNFKDRENENLKPLYDRFDLKVVTEYISDHDNRLNALKKKQNDGKPYPLQKISLLELAQMQEEVRGIQIPDQINELADCILCELRGKGIHISDRTYLNYGSVVQAEAWLNGRDKVAKEDMKVLVNYFWNEPDERVKIREIIDNLLDNQISDQLEEIIAEALAAESQYTNSASDKVKALLVFRNAIVEPFKKCKALAKAAEENGTVPDIITQAISKLEEINTRVHNGTGFTASLENLVSVQEQKGA